MIIETVTKSEAPASWNVSYLTLRCENDGAWCNDKQQK